MGDLEPGTSPDFGDWPREMWGPMLVVMHDIHRATRDIQYQARVLDAKARVLDAKKKLEQIAARDRQGPGKGAQGVLARALVAANAPSPSEPPTCAGPNWLGQPSRSPRRMQGRPGLFQTSCS